MKKEFEYPSFYRTKSNLGDRSTIGAMVNKLPGPEKEELENRLRFRSNSRESLHRVQNYDNQKVIEKNVQTLFDKVKFYPKTVESEALKQIHRAKSKQQ